MVVVKIKVSGGDASEPENDLLTSKVSQDTGDEKRQDQCAIFLRMKYHAWNKHDCRQKECINIIHLQIIERDKDGRDKEYEGQRNGGDQFRGPQEFQAQKPDYHCAGDHQLNFSNRSG